MKHRTIQITLIIALLAVVGLVLSCGSSSEPTVPSGPTQPGNPDPTIAPDFTGVDIITDETVSLAQFKGSVVLLNFMSYGCSPFIDEVTADQLLVIRDLREQRDDFMPISIFCSCCSLDVLRKFIEENDVSWPWILDTDNSIIPQYGEHLLVYEYPTLIFIDEEQYIKEVTSYHDVSMLDAKIDEILQ